MFKIKRLIIPTFAAIVTIAMVLGTSAFKKSQTTRQSNMFSETFFFVGEDFTEAALKEPSNWRTNMSPTPQHCDDPESLQRITCSITLPEGYSDNNQLVSSVDIEANTSGSTISVSQVLDGSTNKLQSSTIGDIPE